jgi:hypothetical protein
VDSSPLVQQGIAAYRAGNKDEAIRLLSQAIRENRSDETAWLYLGACLDDPDKKRKAYERVLELNPNNDKAKNALARLGVAATAAPSSGGKDKMSDSGPKPKQEAPSPGEGFALPFQVEGSPARVTLPYLIENGKTRIQQAIQIFTKYDFEPIVNAGQGATMWDAVFTAGVGVVAVGAADLIGRWIGWPLSLFSGGLGGLIWPIFSAIVAMAGTAAGFAVGNYASRMYVENQKISVSKSQHAMYFALVFLPLVLVNAILSFLTNALPFLVGLLGPVSAIVWLVSAVYGFLLLKGAFDRVYGADNNRGLITAAIAVAGWVVGAFAASLVLGIFGAIVRFAF